MKTYIHKVQIKYKNYRVIGLQKYKLAGKEKVPYTFIDKHGDMTMAYTLKVYKSNKLIKTDRIHGWGAYFLIDKEELREATGLSRTLFTPISSF